MAEKLSVATFVLGIAHDLFFADSDCEEFEIEDVRKTVSNFVEEVVDMYPVVQFRENFRVGRPMFEYLCRHLTSYMPIENDRKVGHPIISVRKQIMVALWILANPGPFRTTAELFGIAKSTARQNLLNVCNALISLNQEDHIIKWPEGNEATATANAFETKYGFPGVIGVIDGMHIPIIKPSKFPESYINRKGFYSIVLQGVCDDRMLLTDCYIGEPGSVHDACVFRRSDLAREMDNPRKLFRDERFHIIGDCAYPLLPNLMIPFKNNGFLTQAQKKYNMKLSSARAIIERSFSLLKRRLRKLKLLEMTKLELIPIIVFACCILHNLCILQDDSEDSDEYEESDSSDSEADEYCNDVIANTYRSIHHLGQQKRNVIVNQL